MADIPSPASLTVSPTATLTLPPVATIAQVAEYIQYSEKTIRRMCDDGRLRAVRSHPGRGGRLRIRREDVLALLGAEAS